MAKLPKREYSSSLNSANLLKSISKLAINGDLIINCSRSIISFPAFSISLISSDNGSNGSGMIISISSTGSTSGTSSGGTSISTSFLIVSRTSPYRLLMVFKLNPPPVLVSSSSSSLQELVEILAVVV